MVEFSSTVLPAPSPYHRIFFLLHLGKNGKGQQHSRWRTQGRTGTSTYWEFRVDDDDAGLAWHDIIACDRLQQLTTTHSRPGCCRHGYHINFISRYHHTVHMHTLFGFVSPTFLPAATPGFTSHSTQNRSFRRQSLGLIWKTKPNRTKARIPPIKRNVLQHKINTKKLKPGLVASYDIRPANGEGLFWFWHLLT